MTYLAKRQWEKAVAEAERLDDPWRLDDLEAKRDVVPDAENSYQIVVNASRLLPFDWPRWYTAQPFLNDLEPNVHLEPPAVSALRREMNGAADNNGALSRGSRYAKKGTDLGSQLWNVDQRRLPYRPPAKEE